MPFISVESTKMARYNPCGSVKCGCLCLNVGLAPWRQIIIASQLFQHYVPDGICLKSFVSGKQLGFQIYIATSFVTSCFLFSFRFFCFC